MKVRKIKKEDFNQYKILRNEGLEEYQKLTEEKLKISYNQIKKEFEDTINNKKRIAFIIQENKEIKAYIIGTLIKNSYQRITYLDDIYVKKDTRNKGLGKQLLKEFTKWSKSKKATKIRLGVSIKNIKVINLYKNRGFKIKHYEMEKSL